MPNNLCCQARTKLVRSEDPCSYDPYTHARTPEARTSRREVGTSALSGTSCMGYGSSLGKSEGEARTGFTRFGIVGLAQNYRRQVLTIQLQKESRDAG